MNFNALMNTMNDTSLTINQRTEAASRLWEASNRLNKSLKSFKSELIEMADDQDLIIESSSGKYTTKVEKQPPTPKLESVDINDIEDAIGEDLFDQYIAHSYTIRWSEFREAPEDVKEAFYNVPNLETMQTYQVKFKRS
tara:strand:+ start:3759 stop:4175 length:417 start_codon:yes stop_codon:yes gene_type:complete